MTTFTRSLGILAVAVAFCDVAFSQQPAAGAPTVLKGATAIDVIGGRTIAEAVIVVDGDKITGFGDRNTRYPSNAVVVDLAGKFVIPGLVDSHTHYRPFTGEVYLNHGVTAAIIIGGTRALGDDYLKNSQTSDFRTPRLYGSGRRSIRELVSASMTREQVRALVQQWAKDDRPDLATMEQYPADNPRLQQVWQWFAEDLHEAGLFVFGHTDNAPASIRAGHDGVEHLWGFSQALMTAQELDDYQKGKYLHWGLFFRNDPRIDPIIRDAVQRGVYLNPTLVYELGSFSSLARRHEALAYDLYKDGALMSYYPPNLAQGLLLKFRLARNFSTQYENFVPFSKLPPRDLETFQDAYRQSGDFVQRWVQAGGKIMAGTDDPSVGTSGLSVHMEMAMLVEMGLTPLQALQSMTIWGAEPLTARRKVATKPPVGFIGDGAFADLVVLGANPLQNIENTRRIERVMKGGRFITLGYTPHYAPLEEFEAITATPEPEISGITPNTVTEGSAAFDIVVEGVGFVSESVVHVNGQPVPTTFVDVRTIKARVPAAAVARAVPNPFMKPGPEQRVGVFGDRTVKITVFNHPPDGGRSTPVSLRVRAKWMAPPQSSN
jgi:hypothetical protein